MGLAIPPGVASTLPRRVQDLLYGIYPPLLGYAGGGLFRSEKDIYNLANLVKLLED